jgi:hypothetical protein
MAIQTDKSIAVAGVSGIADRASNVVTRRSMVAAKPSFTESSDSLTKARRRTSGGTGTETTVSDLDPRVILSTTKTTDVSDKNVRTSIGRSSVDIVDIAIG